MAANSGIVDLPVTLHLTERAKAKLAERAAAGGTDLSGYISAIVEQTATKPLSLEEISGPIHQRFLESGLTDEQLGDLLEEEKHAARAERRAHFFVTSESQKVVYDSNVYVQALINLNGPAGECVRLALASRVSLF